MQQNQSLEITKVALDAMGGDYAPAEPVKGAVDAVNARSDIKAVSYTHLTLPTICSV